MNDYYGYGLEEMKRKKREIDEAGVGAIPADVALAEREEIKKIMNKAPSELCEGDSIILDIIIQRQAAA